MSPKGNEPWPEPGSPLFLQNPPRPAGLAGKHLRAGGIYFVSAAFGATTRVLLQPPLATPPQSRFNRRLWRLTGLAGARLAAISCNLLHVLHHSGLGPRLRLRRQLAQNAVLLAFPDEGFFQHLIHVIDEDEFQFPLDVGRDIF